MSQRSTKATIDMDEEQRHRAALRERFLRAMSALGGKEVSISMHERTTVSARWVAPKADLSHVIVDDLKTPLGKFPCAVLRMGDIVAVRCPWQAIAPGQQPPESPQAGSTMMDRPG